MYGRVEGDGEVGPSEEAAATEKPTTVEVGRAFRFDWDDEDEADGWRRDAHDFFGRAGTGATGACVTSSFRGSSTCLIGSSKSIDVLDDMGVCSWVSVSVVVVVVSVSSEGRVGGEGGGVGMSRALRTMSGGGLALVDMMIPGALEGSDGRLDQTAHSTAFDMAIDDKTCSTTTHVNIRQFRNRRSAFHLEFFTLGEFKKDQRGLDISYPFEVENNSRRYILRP